MANPTAKSLHINVQFDSDINDTHPLPKKTNLIAWIKTALPADTREANITLRIVGLTEITRLNTTYLGKKGPTNVLAFPDMEDGTQAMAQTMNRVVQGDIAICADIVIKEAAEQNKQIEAHWAHLTMHAVLHLCGYDHIDADDAVVMEALEIQLLNKLGFSNPYDI